VISFGKRSERVNTASLRAAVAALLVDPQDRVLAQSILGTVDVETIALRVEGYVRESFRRSIAGCVLFTQSVGAVFILDLDDGSRVVLKAHAVGAGRLRTFASLDAIETVYAVQARLADAGWPCARVPQWSATSTMEEHCGLDEIRPGRSRRS
jgi:hypothetical protein